MRLAHILKTKINWQNYKAHGHKLHLRCRNKSPVHSSKTIGGIRITKKCVKHRGNLRFLPSAKCAVNDLGWMNGIFRPRWKGKFGPYAMQSLWRRLTAFSCFFSYQIVYCWCWMAQVVFPSLTWTWLRLGFFIMAQPDFCNKGHMSWAQRAIDDFA